MQRTKIQQQLADIVELPGVPGYEMAVSERIREIFSEHCPEVWVDKFHSVYGKIKGDQPGPTVMFSAHMDEIGMIVTGVDDDGFLRFSNMGGIDQRVLLCQEVTVYGKKPLFGVIGAKPPHVLRGTDTSKSIEMTELTIDIGYDAQQARELVGVGDIVTFRGAAVDLHDGAMASKTMDDRACVAMLVEAMAQLKSRKFIGEAVFVASVQEEVGCRGAKISAYAIDPDIAMAVDVCHGDTPDSPRDEVFPMDKITICTGPNMQPALTKKLMQVADAENIGYSVEACPGPTGTDARAIQISREGVPTLLMSVPTRYMHTTVETLRYPVIAASGKLIACFLASLESNWEESLWC